MEILPSNHSFGLGRKWTTQELFIFWNSTNSAEWNTALRLENSDEEIHLAIYRAGPSASFLRVRRDYHIGIMGTSLIAISRTQPSQLSWRYSVHSKPQTPPPNWITRMADFFRATLSEWAGIIMLSQ